MAFLICLLSFFACQSENKATKTAKVVNTEIASLPPVDTIIPPAQIQPLPSSLQFPWKASVDAKDLLVNRLAPPPGFRRSSLAEDSYGNWLRHLPLKEADSPVLLFNGDHKGRQDVHAAVVDIDVGKRDLQQCADAVMRLRAEYFFSQKNYSKIHFNYTSGDKVSFDDWRQGRKPKVQGNKVVFSAKTSNVNNSYANFKAYLQQIFNYAGTASLSKELKPISIADLQIGDVFIKGGFPGHAVLVLDMVINDEGEKCFLLGQSYMPAQNIHILRNPNDPTRSPWYSTNFGTVLNTPEWTFYEEQLYRH